MLGERNICEYLDDNAVRRGRHPAVITDETVLSYSEFVLHVSRFASQLVRSGIRENEIVGVSLRDSANHLTALFALARIGAAILPLDWRWTDEEKSNVSRYFGLETCLVEPDQPIAGARSLEIGLSWQESVERAAPHEEIASGGDRPLLLSLSSGTTGRPKGPMISHRQFASRLIVQWVTLGFSQHDRYLNAIPLYFGGGRSFAMGSLFSGGTVVLFPQPYSVEELVAKVNSAEPTTILLVPTLLRRLVKLPVGERPLMHRLRWLISTGAALHGEERRQVMERLNPNFINYYGSTEGGGITVLLPHHRGDAESSVGEPVFGTKVQIVDDDGTPLGPHTDGLVRFRGPSVANSFYKDPEASSAAFRDGWFYPGDIGHLDANGLLYLSGRAKDVINRAGVNIYPDEIEQCLRSHPEIQDAAVVGWPNRETGEEIAAFVVTRNRIDDEEIRHFCSQKLAPYKVPRLVTAIDELPKSPLGKVLKKELAHLLPDQPND